MSSNIILISGDDAEQIRKLTATAVKKMGGENADEFSLDIIKSWKGHFYYLQII